MLKPKTRWNLRTADENKVAELAEELHITPLVAALLVNRGLDTIESARSFLFVKNQTFHDPFLLKDMDKAVYRIKEAIQNGEKIRVFGDYDADGVTSTTVMMTTLTRLGADVDFYIPNRFTEGYGPNPMAFRLAAEQGVKVLITVDTGISAVDEAKLASELGMDYILTDHHEPGPELPEALAIIHPKLEDSSYPFEDLAGVGVAFKLAHALLGELPEDLLEIAAIGTIADLVPLKGENRLIAAKGIEQLRLTRRPGLVALMKVANIQQEALNEESIGFAMAPRINAVGRLGDADPAVDLLMSENLAEATELANEIDDINKERQAMVAAMAEEAIQEVEENFPPESNGVLIIGREGWNAGVVGIVASKLVERFYRPTIVLSYDREKGHAKGSARSIAGFDLFESLSTCRELLPHFGGHPMAAGMTLKIEDVQELRDRMNMIAKEQLSEEDFTPITNLDGATTLAEVSIQTIQEMSLLAPFGVTNPKPKILIDSVQLSSVRKIGANQNHLKVQLEDSENHKLDGVGFGLGHYVDEIAPHAEVSVIGELSINEWNNIKKPQIFVQDVSVNHWQLFDYRGKGQAEKWLAEIPVHNRKIVIFSEDIYRRYPFLQNHPDLVLIKNEQEADQLDCMQGHVVLMDMPPLRELLKRVIENKKPSRIYAHFSHEQDHFLSTVPTRDDFKWFYAFLAKKGPLDVKRYGDDLAKYRGWSRDTVDFISKVFFELDFVTIENGLIMLTANAKKRDLSESESFIRKKEQFELEQELVYSSYQQLFDWFNHFLVHEATDLEEETKQWI
ncbi:MULTISPECIES: single-stranded-DNA-specific exonuclease RecJ [unclassified Peribacillus]|uniref:single-stranded-DNA-specific exonuclease RecJ n=1 Tax=unclassified Peribacillus TaxID=2675266 RepID=UPI0019144187|nr:MULTISPECIES: single-stranded-DNA-specific exonuclease RecJ [unclassified Peribacillus]MBK5442746.1 single-stranded-DNA-specific exonuclease RecJ [Peribacillus sp. TH24]MBK5462512.1 single-stranded-DNA-specific exonuclease RecJ [Peribacillus sp. TH27]MBK5484151.1 single-stranded-DNA-specific exonuclease RecJ [Peribacillus sp. TH16]MBK5500666.1 single-stranded-DNA-specific exonuclease RecJ [Peribacillus sp. TH14]WMX54319.1 single-stranded-DNA-specific exonuclease RecJ [Peribacillus sp. R9-11